jgi:hypothetical protein
MKRVIIYLIVLLVTNSAVSNAQTTLKNYKAGHIFDLSLPDYMSKTGGLNSSAAIQYKSLVKDVYGFVIYDTKEELELIEYKFASVAEFYEDFIKDFLKDEPKRTLSKPVATSKNGINFIETDLTYYDNDAKAEIYYLVGVVETPKAYYKVLSWCAAENKKNFKADFQKIIYSLKD